MDRISPSSVSSLDNPQVEVIYVMGIFNRPDVLGLSNRPVGVEKKGI
jgi:hypothetical protein